jgi:glycosyltransferase involved in cell wall biosynthesis
MDKKIILYTGHLYDWKGVDVIRRAAKGLPDVFFYIIGGTSIDRDDYRRNLENEGVLNVHLEGLKPYRDIPEVVQAADILLLPNSARTKIGRDFTSPLKLFEYMASGVPILATRVPAVREIIDDNLATFFEPDDAGSLVAAAQQILGNYDDMLAKARRAQNLSLEYDWTQRARNILSFIKNVQ